MPLPTQGNIVEARKLEHNCPPTPKPKKEENQHKSSQIHIKTFWSLLPYHTIPYHTIPYHTIPYHTIPYHTIPYHTIPYHTIPYHTIPYYTILYYTILYYTILYYTILYCTTLYYTILYYTILYYTILYYTILYYTRLYYTILYDTIPYHTIPYNTTLLFRKQGDSSGPHNLPGTRQHRDAVLAQGQGLPRQVNRFLRQTQVSWEVLCIQQICMRVDIYINLYNK